MTPNSSGGRQAVSYMRTPSPALGWIANSPHPFVSFRTPLQWSTDKLQQLQFNTSTRLYVFDKLRAVRLSFQDASSCTAAATIVGTGVGGVNTGSIDGGLSPSSSASRAAPSAAYSGRGGNVFTDAAMWASVDAVASCKAIAPSTFCRSSSTLHISKTWAGAINSQCLEASARRENSMLHAQASAHLHRRLTLGTELPRARTQWASSSRVLPL